MVNGVSLKNAIISGANNIAIHKKEIDSLNIFPVPDGDTGTNMTMTILTAVTELEKLENPTVSEVVSKTASAMLRGARGNSGVILSIIFRGLSKGLKDKEVASGKDLVEALGIGVSDAYKAVMKPTEGTMLTVARRAYEVSKSAVEISANYIYTWNTICDAAKEALKATPELLPVLKKAGVVDAGGKGLCCIFEGMQEYFVNGNIIVNTDIENNKPSKQDEDYFRNAAAEFDDVINFTYCTEFIVGRDKKVTLEPMKLREYLETIGDCVVVVDDDDIIKVHVHTENPGDALQKGLKYGALLTVKVENMKEQHRNAKENNQNDKQNIKDETPRFAEPSAELGFVSVAAGNGLENLFQELGCAEVVRGGQSMNPSTDDIYKSVMATPAKTVIILPNNKNVIMAAEQVIPLVNDREVIVLPSKTIPQGISALLSYDSEISIQDNLVIMADAMNNVKTGQVTFAARDSEFGSTKIKKDDIIALENGKLTLKEKDPVKAVVKLIKDMISKDTAFVTIIYGNGITEEQANTAYEIIKSKVGNHIDISLVEGNQPIYYFIVSVE